MEIMGKAERRTGNGRILGSVGKGHRDCTRSGLCLFTMAENKANCKVGRDLSTGLDGATGSGLYRATEHLGSRTAGGRLCRAGRPGYLSKQQQRKSWDSPHIEGQVGVDKRARR